MLACLGFVCHGERIATINGSMQGQTANRLNSLFDTDVSSLLQANQTNYHVSSHSGLNPLKMLSLLLLAANPADAFNADVLRSLPAFRGLGTQGHSRSSGNAQSRAAFQLGLFQGREVELSRLKRTSNLDLGEAEKSNLAQDQAEMSQSVRKQAFATMATTDRVQRLKNILTDRLILNVLTSCEFALLLEVSGESSAKIDFPNLLKRIDNGIDILQLRYNGQTGDEDVLMERLRVASEQLSKCMEGCDLDSAEAALKEAALDGILQGTVASTGADNDAEAREPIPSLNFVVREDGTVDYDELLASSREVARFGVELWERLNGREEELPDIMDLLGQAPGKSEKVTAEVQRLQAAKDRSQDVLNNMLERGVQTRAQLRLTKESGRPISNDDMVIVRTIDQKVEELRKVVALCEFNLDIERICVYLEKDMQESVADSLELKPVVAEVNLIERQLMSVMGGLGTEELEKIMEDKDVTASNTCLSLVDDEELGLIRSNIEELKTRLGIAGSLAAPIDYGTVGEVWGNFVTQTKAGLGFYGGGAQMLGSDLQNTGKLFLKALNGKTLLPREVNSIRRTAKDLATLVPFLIILITPITPLGHVLVFSFIQRFFPEFFPSFFTDKRQNLRQLSSDVLTMDEEALLGPPPKQQSRLSILAKKINLAGERNPDDSK